MAYFTSEINRIFYLLKMDSDNKKILVTENLSVGYRSPKSQKVILENMNLDLHKGEMVCIIGPNGSGKSTLLRSLARLQAPLGGEIYLKNRLISEYSRKALAQNISLVLTEKTGTLNISVKDLIALGRYPYTSFTGKLLPEDELKINSAIDKTDLSAIAESKVNELSDGQLQKVMIARALAQEGDLMILDEPTAHLDLNNRVDIMSLLKSICRNEGKAMLISTHDLDLAMETADRFWLTNNKSLIDGSPEDLAVNGILSSIFKSPNYYFNIFSGRFILNKTSNKAISLEGPEPYFFWTKHALEKEGFFLTDKLPDITRVIIEEKDPLWNIIVHKKTVSFNSIKKLISYLKSNTFSA